MQAYPTAERLASEQLRTLAPSSVSPRRELPAPAGSDEALFDQLLTRLADLIADRLMERAGVAENTCVGDWLDARSAAEYLHVHRDTLRKLAAERVIPVHQDGPGCKLYFRRDELDDWRRSSKAMRSRLRAVA